MIFCGNLRLTSFSTLKRVVKGQCSCRPWRESIHTKPEKVKCKSLRSYRMSVVRRLPHWDMTVVYPGLESPEFAQGFSHVVQAIDELTHLFDEYHIKEQPASQGREVLKRAPLRSAEAPTTDT